MRGEAERDDLNDSKQERTNIFQWHFLYSICKNHRARMSEKKAAFALPRKVRLMGICIPSDSTNSFFLIAAMCL